MSLKLPSIFIIGIICLLSFNSVNAMTVDDLLNSNPTGVQVQQAVDNGSIRYQDLPGMWQVNIHDVGQSQSEPTKPATDTSTPNNKSTFDPSIIIILFVAVLIIPIVITGINFTLGSGFRSSDDKPKVSRVHKILFHIGLAKKVNDDGETDRWSKTISEDKDLTGLDDSFSEHDYSGESKPKKSKPKQSKTIKIKSHHSILVSLGLAKVVKK